MSRTNRLASAHRGRSALPCALLLLSCGCLTNERERPGYSPELRPQGARVESVEDDVVLRQRIAANAGVGAFVPLRTGYASGREVSYWDFGEASASPEPLWQFRRRGEGGAALEIDHFDLVDSVPGDSNYSPIRALYTVFVTDAYDGELITSAQALEDAIELGLLEEPEPAGVAVNWPVVPAETALELPDGQEPLAPSPVYYRGRIATCFRIGGMDEGTGVFPLGRGSLGAPNVYALRRQNEDAALDEAERGEDLNGDGDQLDSQLVFSASPGDEAYTSLWQPIEVTVTPDYAFGAKKAEAELFEAGASGLRAVSDAVVSFGEGEEVVNRPIVHAP